MEVDPEFLKALGGLGFATFFGGALATLMKRQTEKEGQKLAEARYVLEEREKTERELLERRNEEAARREELRADLRSERERNAELLVKHSRLQDLYESRVYACRLCDYPCHDTLTQLAVMKVKDERSRQDKPGEPPGNGG